MKDVSEIIITQATIDTSSNWVNGVYTLRPGYDYILLNNIALPVNKHFADGGCNSFYGLGKTITVVPDGANTLCRGVFDGSGTVMNVQYLYVHAYRTTLDASAGWIFRHGTKSAYAYRCGVNGPINGAGSGGIFGADTDSNFGGLNATRCYSTGDITGAGAGGIFGANSNGAWLDTCYSWGAISGVDAGGILGSDSLEIIVLNSYTLGAISPRSGGIWGTTTTVKDGSERLYVAGASDASGAFIAGVISDVSGWNLTNGWSDAVVSGTLNISQGYWSWGPNIPLRLTKQACAEASAEGLTSFISQLDATFTAPINPASLTVVPPLTGTEAIVTFVPNGGVATAAQNDNVYIPGTPGIPCSVTLNGTVLQITFNSDSSCVINNKTCRLGDTIEAGGVRFGLIGFGSGLFSGLAGECVPEKPLNNTERAGNIKGNMILIDQVERSANKFKTYADYIAYVKAANRCCC